MLLQTNSYIVPRDKRSEHARLLRRFRQTLIRLGCDHFEVYEQVGANWNTGETTGRFVQILRFRDRKHQIDVQTAERNDPIAQQLVQDFCELINFPYQQQQGLFAVGFYTSFLKMPPQRTAQVTASTDAGEVEAAPAEAVDYDATSAAEPGVVVNAPEGGDAVGPEFVGEAGPAEDASEEKPSGGRADAGHASAGAVRTEDDELTDLEPDAVPAEHEPIDLEEALAGDGTPAGEIPAEKLLEVGEEVEEAPPWLGAEKPRPVDLDEPGDEEADDFDRLTPEEIAKAEAALNAPDDEPIDDHADNAHRPSGRASR